MKTPNTKFETYLPVFPGFYGTIFNSECAEENELEYINQEREAKGLEPISWDDCEFDYKDYRDRLSKACVDAIESELKSLSLISEIKFQSLVSPKYYNFANDSINIEIDVNIKKLQKYISENKNALSEYINENYTSYDGFMSSYSNDIDVWSEDTERFTNWDTNEHYLGSVLDFVCKNEGIDYYRLYEGCDGEPYYINATNYTDLLPE